MTDVSLGAQSSIVGRITPLQFKNDLVDIDHSANMPASMSGFHPFLPLAT